MSMVDNSQLKYHWTREKTIKFIRLVKKHRLLWDSNSKHFRNNFQRELAYDAISFEMQLTNLLVRKKIHTLRSSYRSEIRKMREKNTNEPVWEHFNAVKFLFQKTNSNNTEIDDNSSDETENLCNEDNNTSLTKKRQRLDRDESDELEQQNVDETGQSNYKWTKEETLNLIKLYRQYPVLYNMKSPLYINKNKREQALNEIAKKFNTTADNVRKKLHTLRSAYTAEFRRMKRKNLEKPTWPLFDELKFLYAEEFYKPRASYKKTLDCFDSLNEDTIEYLTDDFPVDETETVLLENNEVPGKKLYENQSSTYKSCEKRDEFTIFGETVASELRLTKDYNEIHNMLKRQIIEAVKEARESIADFTE